MVQKSDSYSLLSDVGHFLVVDYHQDNIDRMCHLLIFDVLV